MLRSDIDGSDGNCSHIDSDGGALAGDEAARCLALDALPDMVRAVLPDGDQREFAIRGRDHGGRVIDGASLTLTGAWSESGAGDGVSRPAPERGGRLGNRCSILLSYRDARRTV